MKELDVDMFMGEFPEILESEFVFNHMLQNFVLACCLAARSSRDNAQTIVDAIEKSPNKEKVWPLLEAMKMHLGHESRMPREIREFAEHLIPVIEGKENEWGV